MQGANLVFMRPVPRQLSREQAIALAAWLVALADPDESKFAAKLKEITDC